MLESKFGVLFRHWLKANPGMTGAYEMKQTSGNSIAFSCLEDHQQTYLEAINGNKGVLVRVQGVNGEPDYVYMRNCPAWVVVKFPKSFEIISVATWAIEKSKSRRKSLTAARAAEISVTSVRLR